VVDSDRKSVV